MKRRRHMSDPKIHSRRNQGFGFRSSSKGAEVNPEQARDLAALQSLEAMLKASKVGLNIAMALGLVGVAVAISSGSAIWFPIITGLGVLLVKIVHFVWGRNDMTLLRELRKREREVREREVREAQNETALRVAGRQAVTRNPLT